MQEIFSNDSQSRLIKFEKLSLISVEITWRVCFYARKSYYFCNLVKILRIFHVLNLLKNLKFKCEIGECEMFIFMEEICINL